MSRRRSGLIWALERASNYARQARGSAVDIVRAALYLVCLHEKWSPMEIKRLIVSVCVSLTRSPCAISLASSWAPQHRGAIDRKTRELGALLRPYRDASLDTANVISGLRARKRMSGAICLAGLLHAGTFAGRISIAGWLAPMRIGSRIGAFLGGQSALEMAGNAFLANKIE